MDFVDEKHVVLLEACEKAREVARFVEHRPRGHAHVDFQFVGDDMRKGGLAETRRAVEQDVVERFATALGGMHEHFEIVEHLLLASEGAERGWAESPFHLALLRALAMSCSI